ncbi:MAG: hypothetical protein FWH03_01870 [Firmicutes bacterium]|nr:hypothetical protein [Bacillota bacterium]
MKKFLLGLAILIMLVTTLFVSVFADFDTSQNSAQPSADLEIPQGLFSAGKNNVYFDFDLSGAPDFSAYISDENELILERILSGEYNAVDYLDWFLFNPYYSYRYDVAALQCMQAVLQEGSFTEALRAQYLGLYINATPSYLAAIGIKGQSYQIYFNEDWSVNYIWEFFIFDGRLDNFCLWYFSSSEYQFGTWQYGIWNKKVSEVRQLDNHYSPMYDNKNLAGYYLSFSSLYIVADMGNGKTAACSVYVSYTQEMAINSVWHGEQQSHKEVSFVSMCTITVDFNGVYAQGVGGMFNRILLFTQQEGVWDLEKVWTEYSAQALTPNENILPYNMDKILDFG